jgi:predicted aspartyl protease
MPSRSNITSLPLRLISLDQDGFHLMLKAKLNNKTARLILDTGASKTVFDKEKAAKYVKHNEFIKSDHLSTGLGTDTMESHSVIITKFALGDIVIGNFNIVLLDLSHISRSYSQMGLPEIDGVLGGDILRMYRAKIDYDKLMLVIKGI